jgi:TfoX/Sxy family transcriptional regulator of competence genes
MAYDKDLADRVGHALAAEPGLEQKRMFGGVGYLLFGNMVCGVLKDDLIVRVGKEHYDDLLADPSARVFDITGREMKGWVMIDPDGTDSDQSLSSWVHHGLAFARTLPPKNQ